MRNAYLNFGMNNNYRVDSLYAPSFIDGEKIYYSSTKYHYTNNGVDSTVECYQSGECDTYKFKQTREETDSALRYVYGLNSDNPDELEIITSFVLRNDTLYEEYWNSNGTPSEHGNTIRTPDPEKENACLATNYTLNKQGNSYTKSFGEPYQEFIEATEAGFSLSYSNNDAKVFL